MVSRRVLEMVSVLFSSVRTKRRPFYYKSMDVGGIQITLIVP